jgi:hypothetical protein
MLIFQTQTGLFTLAMVSAQMFPMHFSVFKGQLTDDLHLTRLNSVSHTRETEKFFEDSPSQNNLLTDSLNLTVPDVFLWDVVTQNSVHW